MLEIVVTAFCAAVVGYNVACLWRDHRRSKKRGYVNNPPAYEWNKHLEGD